MSSPETAPGGRLSALDAALLRIERDVQPVQIGVLLVLAGEAPSRETLTHLLAERMPRRLRQVPTGGPGRRPVWTDVHVDVSRHVHLHDLRIGADTADGGAWDAASALQGLVGSLGARRLPRDRPLWDAHLVPDAGGNRWAALLRAHHAVVDGIAGVDALLDLLDPPAGGEATPVAAPALTPGVGRAATAGATPRRLLAGVAALARSVGTPERTLSGPLSRSRSWRWARGDLAALRGVARAADATLNDVVLTAVAGGLRELLLSRGVDPRGTTLRCLVPVSLRAEDQRGLGGNIVTGVVARLPVGEPDPAARLDLVGRELRGLKASPAALGAVAAFGLAERLPEPLAAGLVRASAVAPRGWVATAVTNVPGPVADRSMAGCRVVEAFPVVPLGQRMRITVGLLSSGSRLACGITADGVHVPEIDLVADAVTATWDDLAAGIIGP